MRRLVLWIFSAALVAAVLWTGWWFYLVHRLSTGLDQWAAARRAEGWTVQIGDTGFGGWPATARLSLHRVTIRGGGPLLPVPLDWHGTGLDLDLAPLSPAVLVMRPVGRQTIAVAGTKPMAMSGVLQVRLDLRDASGSVPLAFAGGPLRVAPAHNGKESADGGAAVIETLAGNATVDSAAGPKSDALSLTFDCGRIELPAHHPWPLGEVVQSASGEIAVTGPVPPPGTGQARARTWQQAGGQVRLRQGTLHWGPLEAAATGTGGLDAALQPDVTLNLHATGYAKAMDVLAAHHVMPETAALVAKAVLSLVAITPSGGGEPELSVPLTLQDGILSTHGIPLVRMPPITWQEGPQQ